jgi:hypothetical protein
MTDGPERGQTAAVPRRDPDTASRKMIAVDEATRRPRKRSKYAEKACNRCKKKKIRCNAQMPCNQCETRGRMDCCYDTARAAHNPAWSWDNQSFSNTWSLSGRAINTPNLTYVSSKLLGHHTNFACHAEIRLNYRHCRELFKNNRKNWTWSSTEYPL